VPAIDRRFERGTYLALRDLRTLGSEFRERRLELGLSQEAIAAACRLSRPRYTRIEAGKVMTLSLPEIHRIGGVLGLDPVVRLYPSGVPVRDRGHATRLQMLLANAAAPLTKRTEVPLRNERGGIGMRAWDAMLFGHDERTALELEMRLRDIQAAERRAALKRRDDPTEHFLLVVADTKANRRVLRELLAFADLPRLRKRDVVAALRKGQHPATGLVLF
jgi:transcriptional regulator with XRE-family HTH domain